MVKITGHSGRPGLAAASWPGVGIAASYAAGFAAFAHAMMDLYWALGGHALLGTVGGYAERLARQGASFRYFSPFPRARFR